MASMVEARTTSEISILQLAPLGKVFVEDGSSGGLFREFPFLPFIDRLKLVLKYARAALTCISTPLESVSSSILSG